ncbi:MAG: RNA polymerase sigma factor [Planctomycetia bacterium]|nr:RNA polymerase sigma factor [Planctomycetia bacterium]
MSSTIAADPTAPSSLSVDVADQDDIAATLAGDGAAYARLVQRYQPRVAATMWRFTRDRQAYEELVHEVFVEAYLNLANYRGESPLVNWLLAIATRVGYRHWKERARRQKRGEQSLSDLDVPAGNAATARYADSAEHVASLEQVEAAEQVHRQLAQLPPRDRLVLTLIYLEQCSVEEAARRIGWTRTMTKVQAFRARGKLRKLLEGGSQ